MSLLKNLGHFVFFAFAAFGSAEALASDWGAGLKYRATSDEAHWRAQQVSYESYRTDLTYPYKNEGEQGLGYRLEATHATGNTIQDGFAAVNFAGHVVAKLSPNFNLSFGLGVHKLEVEDVDQLEATVGVAHLQTQWQYRAQQFLQFRYDHDFKYADLGVRGGDDDFLRSDRFEIASYQRFSERWRMVTQLVQEEYSDHNHKFELKPQILYGVLPSSPWFWVGLGAEYLTFANDETGYWSPSHFLAWGPRAEFAAPLGVETSDWQIVSGVTGNFLKEESSPSGQGYSWSLGVQKGLRDEMHGGLSTYQIVSEQAGSTWREEGVQVSFVAPF